MSNIAIPNLPPVIALSGSELIEVVQAGTSSRATVTQLSQFLQAYTAGPGLTLSGMQFSITNTGVNAGSYTVPNFTVNARGQITAISNATTTGTGAVVLATSPTLVTPALGAPSAVVLTNATGLPLSTGTVGVLGVGSGGTGVTTSTGTGPVVLSNSPTLVTPTFATGGYQMTAQSMPSYSEGLVWYDSTQHSLAFYNDGVTSPVYIGEDVQVKVINNTGSTIANCTAVYVTGTASGQIYPNIAPAKADVSATSAVIGLTNGSIASGAIGYVTSQGIITNVNTGIFAPGTVLYLSPYSAGQLQGTVPPTGFAVQVGTVTYQNSSTGQIYVKQTAPLAVSASTIIGTVAVANGGTGIATTPANGALLIGNGSGYTSATLTAGSNIVITNTAGGITIASTGGGSGTVTSVNASGGTTGLTFSGGPVTTSGTLTLAGTLAVANGGTGVTTSTGTGSVVLSNSPTLVTPALGTPTAIVLTNATGLPLSTGATGTLPVGNGGTGLATLSSNYIYKGAGTSAMVQSVIYDDGTNVGIGTSNNFDKLTVAGTNALSYVGASFVNFSSNGASQVSFSDGTTTIAKIFSGNSAYPYYGGSGSLNYTANSGPHIWYNNYVERMRSDPSGNLGVGTGSPSTYGLIAAVKNATGVTTIAVSNSNSATNDGAKLSSFYGTTEMNSIGHYWNGSAFIGRIYSYGTLTFLAGSTPTEYLRLQSNGNFGVGTLNPGALFDVGGNFQLTLGGALTSAALANAVGYKGMPQNAQTSAYTLALSDMGGHVSITTGGVVIPANGSVAFPIGATAVIFNNSGSSQTISITTDTLRQAGTANTGSRTLAQYGLATLVKVASTVWVISGAGVS